MIGSWTKSSDDHKRLHGVQRPAGCKFGLGYEENKADKSTVKLNHKKDKFTRVKFVKAGLADLTTDHVGANQKGISKDGNENSKLVYVQPLDGKSSWLKPKNKRQARSAKKSDGQTLRRQMGPRQQTSRHLLNTRRHTSRRPPSQSQQTTRRLPKKKYFF